MCLCIFRALYCLLCCACDPSLRIMAREKKNKVCILFVFLWHQINASIMSNKQETSSSVVENGLENETTKDNSSEQEEEEDEEDIAQEEAEHFERVVRVFKQYGVQSLQQIQHDYIVYTQLPDKHRRLLHPSYPRHLATLRHCVAYNNKYVIVYIIIFIVSMYTWLVLELMHNRRRLGPAEHTK